jgi:hypothetical protein
MTHKTGPLAYREDAAPGAESAGVPFDCRSGRPLDCAQRRLCATSRGRDVYFLGRTASFNCLAMRALTTVLAGILMASPVAGLRPIRALRF